ncbi:MAG TPA: heavy metal translocating P-type ATPase [Phycisphaerales bacterium]|nr:heavy metal translocating P-type ATPase [Phycisphaerales bacterium]
MTTISARIPASLVAAAPCAHCALPVPAGLIEAGAAQQFCCNGCRTAYAVIRSCGLDHFHDLARADPTPRAPARSTGRNYAELDDPAFRDLHIRPLPGGLLSARLTVENIHCAACVWLLERLPAALGGVTEARVDFRRARIELVWDPAAVHLSQIASFIDRLGYPVHPVRERADADHQRRQDRAALVRLGVAAALAMNTMLIAFALYGGALHGMEPRFEALFRVLSALMGVASLAWPGRVFFRSAIASLRVRALHMDVPIALALGVGLGSGLINTIRGTGDVYFETLCTLVFLLLVGRWVQSRQQRRAADAVELLFSITPSAAQRREPGGAVRTVPIEALRVGDIIEVRAGDSVPADARVIEGATQVNNALLTGESRPVNASAGDSICAGSVNLGAPIAAEVLATGEATRAGRLMRLVEESSARRAPIVTSADRLAGRFSAAVLALAAITAALWWSTSPGRAVQLAVALLIVTCPCALGLATPLAIVAAVGRAARHGILIKGGAALEAIARRGTLVLDKTGTLTTGRMTLHDFAGDPSLAPLAAAVEERCVHPVARALAQGLPPSAQAVEVNLVHSLGGGVEATANGRHLLIGSLRFVRERLTDPAEPDWFTRALDEALNAARTPVAIAEDGRLAALATVDDALRDDARASIDALRALGWSIRVLSGDHPEIVRRVAESLGVPDAQQEGGATPERKQEVIEALARSGPVVMVGDGVNDAAALGAATVGVAVHAGAEASLDAADVHLSRPGLAPLVELSRGSTRTLRVIRRNLAVSLGYNAIAVALAMAGLLNPIVAAVIMPISGLTVVLLSCRSRTFGAGPCR